MGKKVRKNKGSRVKPPTICDGLSAETFDRADYWRHVVEMDGPRVAAWLVREHRARLKRDGVISFSLPAGATLPNWMRAGLDCLRARRGWSVVEVFARHVDPNAIPLPDLPETIQAPEERRWLVSRDAWNSSSKLVGPRAERS
jgi:hypothetical protein